MSATLSDLRRIERQLVILRKRSTVPTASYPQYRDDPLGFIRDKLHITLSPGQVRVVESMMSLPRRVLVSSGHSVGKTILGACLVLWFFHTRSEGVCITTAPTDRQVKLLLWKEIRTLSHAARLPNCWAGPKIPLLESSPAHFAIGFTAADATRFHGQHSPGGLLFIFDEAEGIGAEFFQAVKTMLDDQSYFVALYNPTGGTGTPTHEAERQADEHQQYTRVTLSCLDHPNITGVGAPIRGAITRDQLRLMLLEDSMQLADGDEPQSGDIVLEGERFRPGPIAQARCLGRRPDLSTAGLWTEDLWNRVLATRFDIRDEWPVVIGCDVARYGDNQTVIVARKGYCLLSAEVYSKQPTDFVARKIREMCNRYRDDHNPEKRIPCMIDEGGVGAGVIDQADGYLFVPVNASRKPKNPKRYINVRAELWFNGRQAGLQGCLDVSRLPAAILSRLRQELLATKYEIVEGRDQVRVSSKDDAVANLKRSPDLADALNLSLYS